MENPYKEKSFVMFNRIAGYRDEAQRMTQILDGGAEAIGPYAQGSSGDTVKAQVDELIVAEYSLLSARRVFDELANKLDACVRELYAMYHMDDAEQLADVSDEQTKNAETVLSIADHLNERR